MLSSSLLQLTDFGTLRKIFHLRPTNSTDPTSIAFVDEHSPKNIHKIANEFLLRIEKIATLNSSSQLDTDEEENLKNFFFPTRDKMLRYLHLILQYAKTLIEADAKVLEVCTESFVPSPTNNNCYISFSVDIPLFRIWRSQWLIEGPVTIQPFRLPHFSVHRSGQPALPRQLHGRRLVDQSGVFDLPDLHESSLAGTCLSSSWIK